MAYTIKTKYRRDASTAWLEQTNPLRGLSISQAQSIFDNARNGNYTLLQYIYSEIERSDPMLMTCVERRSAALTGLGWKCAPRANADQTLADEQAAAIDEFIEKIDNFEEALEHLDSAFFRGFAHAEPVWNENGDCVHLICPNSWNFVQNPVEGTWYWNKDAKYADWTDKSLVEIPAGQMVTVERRRAIDHPALSIYLRSALAERDWGRYIERYGIPPVILTAPENTTEEQKPELVMAAADAADGRSGLLPAGTGVNFATEARGTEPFSVFIAHQQKLVVLLATGGTLTSLAEAGSGTLAGNAQMDVWEQIVARDSAIVGAAIEKTLIRPMLERKFPGRPIAASFELGADRDLSTSEVFDLAGKAKAAGYTVDQADLEERTGFRLQKDEAPQGFGFPNGGMPLQLNGNALQNARNAEGSPDVPKEPETGLDAILRGFAADLGPAADKIKQILSIEDEEERRKAAGELAKELPDLLPKDPELAALFEEELAKEFAGTVGEGETK